MMRSVFGRALHDQWKWLLGWAVFAAVWPAMYVGLYPSIGEFEDLDRLLDQLPPAIREFFASSSLDISSPEGFLNLEFFSFVGPLLVLAYTVVAGGSATAGEEEHGTLDLLLANPVPRWRVVSDKAGLMLAGAVVICIAMWLGAAAGATIAGVDLDLGRVGAALASTLLLGLALGALALALGSMTGQRWLSAGLALAVAIAGFFLNGLGALVDWLEPFRPLSPFYQYIANDPLRNGLDPRNVVVLVGWAVGGYLVAVAAFQRRDLRS
jgi:ABC-2 type transport system permease protein